MSPTQLAREAIKKWPRHPLATNSQINHIRRGFIRARQILGDRYLLAVPVPKKGAAQ